MRTLLVRMRQKDSRVKWWAELGAGSSTYLLFLRIDGAKLARYFELKHWRKNNTTIIITYNLSQIEPKNIVYEHGALISPPELATFIRCEV
ncbi:hypothetical protein BGW80DRAFT_1402878 [Lactifluus volemus]|nr:hypothetical protein BGW80DRAFT_1402878 [Lactifluus volemus]